MYRLASISHITMKTCDILRVSGVSSTVSEGDIPALACRASIRINTVYNIYICYIILSTKMYLDFNSNTHKTMNWTT